jgi:predicted NAD/FAD-dependent oxidoreductase
MIFEKSRGPGGRMSTRWNNLELDPPVGFDHGAQYFHTSSPSFIALIEEARKIGAVEEWKGSVVDLGYGLTSPHVTHSPRWVGTPGMTSLARFMTKGLNLQLQAKIESLERVDKCYRLNLNFGDGRCQIESGFDAVVCAVPAEQVRPLFDEIDPALSKLAASVHSHPTWSVMVASRKRIDVSFDGAFIIDSPLGWIGRDSSKPHRATGDRWILQATADWSQLHQNNTAHEVAILLLEVFSHLTGQSITDPLLIESHRWLYSLPLNALNIGSYFDSEQLLGACGDWLAGASIEDAFLSGYHLGNKLLKTFDSTKFV